MAVRRSPVEGKLTREEYKVVLKALGAYQILLFDQMRNPRFEKVNSSGDSVEAESNLVTQAIKKIHRDLEDLLKGETGTPQTK